MNELCISSGDKKTNNITNQELFGLLDEALEGDDDESDGEFNPYSNTKTEKAEAEQMAINVEQVDESMDESFCKNDDRCGVVPAGMLSASEGLTDMGESPAKIDKDDVSPLRTNDQNSSKLPFAGLRKNYYDPHEPHSAQNRPDANTKNLQWTDSMKIERIPLVNFENKSPTIPGHHPKLKINDTEESPIPF